MSEAAKRPDRRAPPLTETMMKKMVSAALLGRGCEPVGKNTHVDLPVSGDVLCMLDGGRSSEVLFSPLKPTLKSGGFSLFFRNSDFILLCCDFDSDDSLHSGYGAMPHYLEVKPVTVCINEDSLKDKRKKVRGSLNQVQTMHLISPEPLDKMIPDRPRLKYPGTTRGNCVAWISLTPSAEQWSLTVEDKLAVYGHRSIGGDAGVSEDDVRKPGDVEPVFYSFMPRLFYQDLLSCYSVAAWIWLCFLRKTLI